MTNKKITKLKRQSEANFTKRIGNTIYRVSLHFSDADTETAQDKIARLIRMDIQNEKAAS